jgi:SPP1 family predicted phage head-tail adaptor
VTRDDNLPAGSLTQRVTLRGTILDANDEEITGALIAENVPAAKRALRAREIFESGRNVSEAWAEFRIRWRTGLNSVTRLENDGQQFNVDSVVDPTGNKRVLILTARVLR